MGRENTYERDVPFRAGGLPLPVGIALASGLGLLFLLMLVGGPDEGLPIAATVAYLAIYTLAYRILRPAHPRMPAIVRDILAPSAEPAVEHPLARIRRSLPTRPPTSPARRPGHAA